MRANFVAFANALCHLNPTPLSVAVLAPCVWGENLACGVAWQSVLLGRNGAWQGTLNSAKRNTAWRGEFDNETAKRGKIQRHSKASTTNSAWQVFVGEADKAKMGAVFGRGTSLSLSLSLSLVARTFWHTKIFKRFIFWVFAPFLSF